MFNGDMALSRSDPIDARQHDRLFVIPDAIKRHLDTGGTGIDGQQIQSAMAIHVWTRQQKSILKMYRYLTGLFQHCDFCSDALQEIIPRFIEGLGTFLLQLSCQRVHINAGPLKTAYYRSEERRVGKECRSR